MQEQQRLRMARTPGTRRGGRAARARDRSRRRRACSGRGSAATAGRPSGRARTSAPKSTTNCAASAADVDRGRPASAARAFRRRRERAAGPTAEPAVRDREREPVGGHPAAEDVGQPPEQHRERRRRAGASAPAGRTTSRRRSASVGSATKPGKLDLDAGGDRVGGEARGERGERERPLRRGAAAPPSATATNPAASRPVTPMRSRCCDSLSRWSSRTASSVVRAGARCDGLAHSTKIGTPTRGA